MGGFLIMFGVVALALGLLNASILGVGTGVLCIIGGVKALDNESKRKSNGPENGDQEGPV
jgi:hypothetical protein